MAKKTNKTEQVLKLISKDDGSDAAGLMTEDAAPLAEAAGQADAEAAGQTAATGMPEVVVSLKEKEVQELKIETRLHVEIDPEITVKSKQVEATIMQEDFQSMANDADQKEHKMEEEKIVEIEEVHDEEAHYHADRSAEKTVLVNVAEQLVKENIHVVMERMNVCSCPICTNDIAALALNMLPQKYITTNTGRQFTQMDIYKKQYETDVLAALTKACVRVKAGPRHSKED